MTRQCSGAAVAWARGRRGLTLRGTACLRCPRRGLAWPACLMHPDQLAILNWLMLLVAPAVSKLGGSLDAKCASNQCICQWLTLYNQCAANKSLSERTALRLTLMLTFWMGNFAGEMTGTLGCQLFFLQC